MVLTGVRGQIDIAAKDKSFAFGFIGVRILNDQGTIFFTSITFTGPSDT
jgi:hypothetical protein